MGSDPDPKPRSKGEQRRQHILKIITQLHMEGRLSVTIQEIQHLSGIRSFNTMTKQLLALKQEGLIDWDRNAPTISLSSQVES